MISSLTVPKLVSAKPLTYHPPKTSTPPTARVVDAYDRYDKPYALSDKENKITADRVSLLTAQIEKLKKARDHLSSNDEIKKVNRKIDQLQGELRKVKTLAWQIDKLKRAREHLSMTDEVNKVNAKIHQLQAQLKQVLYPEAE